MIMQQCLMASRVCQFCFGKTGAESRRREVVESMFIDLQYQSRQLATLGANVRTRAEVDWRAAKIGYLCDTSTKEASDEELEALKLGLNDNESEVGLGVHVTRHVFDLFDLVLNAIIDALKQTTCRPSDAAQVSTAQN